MMENYFFWRNVVLAQMEDDRAEAHWRAPSDTAHTGELWHCVNCGAVYCEDCLDWTRECFHCYCPCEPGEFY